MNRRAFLLGSAAALVPIPAAPVAAPELVGAEVAAAYSARLVEFLLKEFQAVFAEALSDQMIFGASVLRFQYDPGQDAVSWVRIPPEEWPRFPGSDVVVVRNLSEG